MGQPTLSPDDMDIARNSQGTSCAVIWRVLVVDWDTASALMECIDAMSVMACILSRMKIGLAHLQQPIDAHKIKRSSKKICIQSNMHTM